MRHLAALIALAAAPAHANDGFGGLTATGLTFGQTDKVSMVSEDLRISPERIAVDYLFRNLTGSDVTGEVIFPLPPIPLSDQLMSMWNLPADLGRENLVDFTATVDGAPVAVAIDRRAVIEPDWETRGPPSMTYDNPGRDVTGDLLRFGLPLTVDAGAAVAALLALDPAARAEVTAAGLAEFVPASQGQGGTEEAWPLWSVALRYHWTQTFPAGADVRVSHGYENHPAGGLFYWNHPPEDWLAESYAAYCIDEGTSRAIMKALPKVEETDQVFGQAWNIAYILRTANSWAGPVGHFRLTVDKGAENRVVSLCASGLEKTGPTTFVLERDNFAPESDLDILVIAPMEN